MATAKKPVKKEPEAAPVAEIKEEIKIKARRDNYKRKLARMQIAEEALQIGTRKRNNPKKRKLPIEF